MVARIAGDPRVRQRRERAGLPGEVDPVPDAVQVLGHDDRNAARDEVANGDDAGVGRGGAQSVAVGPAVVAVAHRAILYPNGDRRRPVAAAPVVRDG